MKMNRRDFLKTTLSATAVGAVSPTRAAERSARGPFAGMHGAFAAMYTPFTKENRIDLETIDRLVEYGLKSGLNGFYLTGSTGESMYLSPEERGVVYRRAVKAAKGRCRMIAHVGYTATDDAVRTARLAADAGCDWVSATAPGFLANDFAEVHRHYKMIAESTDLPFLIYSWGQDVNPEKDVRFFDIPNVMGMKYTGKNFPVVQELKGKLNKESVFFCGCDPMLVCSLALGDVFAGGIGLTYNFLPRQYAAVCRHAAANDFHAAAVAQNEANRVRAALPPGYAMRKAVMKYIGIDCGPCRHPFVEPTPEQYATLCEQLDAVGIIRRNEAVL